MCQRTAGAICSQQGWWSIFGKKRSARPRPGPPVHDDRLAIEDEAGRVRHVFTSAEAPNRVWLTDITEHRTGEGKLYLCAIKDASSGRIVGYSIDSRMTSQLAVTALNSAVARRGADGVDVAECIVHSDRGSQFRSRRYVHRLGRHQLVGSMGRVGARGDNAAMESFFALLQKNVLNQRRWDTRDELRIAIVTWRRGTRSHRRASQRSLLLSDDNCESSKSGTGWRQGRCGRGWTSRSDRLGSCTVGWISSPTCLTRVRSGLAEAAISAVLPGADA